MKHKWSKPANAWTVRGRVPVRVQECQHCHSMLMRERELRYGNRNYPLMLWYVPGAKKLKYVDRRPACVMPGAVTTEPTPFQVWADDGGREP